MAVRYTNRPQRPSAAPAASDPYAQAVILHGAGQVARALAIYEQLLAQRSEVAKLSELAGIACMQLERFADAAGHLRLALQKSPDNFGLLNNLAISLKQSGQIVEAVAACRAALRIRPGAADLQCHLGDLLEQSGRPHEAVEAYLGALEGPSPAHAGALRALRKWVTDPACAAQMTAHWSHAATGTDPEILDLIARARVASSSAVGELSSRDLVEKSQALLATGDLVGALWHLEMFLQREPGNAAGWNNLGIVHRRHRDLDQARRAFVRATDLDPGFAPAWNNLGACQMDLGEVEQARQALERAIAADPGLANAHGNLGMLHKHLDDVPRALESYERALALDPGLFETLLNLGNLKYQYGDERGAHAAYLKAAALRPEDPETAYSVGVTEQDPQAAGQHLDRALALRPGFAQAAMARVFNQLKACDWSELEGRLARIESMALDPSMPALAPFWMLAMSGSRRALQTCARKWTAEKVRPLVPASRPPARIEVAKRPSVVRVGVLSGDLRDHAVGQLLVDVLPRIARDRCELWAYDVSPDDGSAVRKSLRDAFHTVRDVALLGTADLAARMQADGIDVLVDMSGYSQHSRSQVLGLRPAPVQASYLGFPGTMGWDAVDWLVADDHLVPALHEREYDERILRLPVCYQPARRFGELQAPRPSRADAGLPEQGLVLASFGNPYKLRPEMFDCWLRVLTASPGSVLWLARYNRAMEDNLRAFTRSRGIDPARLVFAPLLPIEAHMARLGLADIVLDTAPYGSGVTATQAVHAGVPLLTLAGETYVGRMASSLLVALGLPSLVATDLADYEQRALHLAGDRVWRLQQRERLLAALATSPALDLERSARDLEHAFLRLAEAGAGSFTR